MDFHSSETWRRHQLVMVERMKAEIGRFTRPVMRFMGSVSLFYLVSAMTMTAFDSEFASIWGLVIAGGVAACLLVLIAPAFLLAVGIEGYLQRRVRQLDRCL